MQQGIRSAPRPYRFLAVLLACVFTLANYCQLRCSFEEPVARRGTHSCCDHENTPPQSHHGNPECCRSDYPTPEIRSRMVPTPGLSVLAPPAVHVIAPPPMCRPLIFVDRSLRMTSTTVSNPILRI
jgi:hypothetical protein